eukprot:12673408-Prorocentrum_lima.AAC.1
MALVIAMMITITAAMDQPDPPNDNPQQTPDAQTTAPGDAEPQEHTYPNATWLYLYDSNCALLH